MLRDVIKRLFVFAILALTSCQYQNITITGTAVGMDGYTVLIKNDQQKTLFGSNIQAGKFSIPQEVLPESGYYTLNISKSNTDDSQDFEVYLEPGTYNIQFNKAHTSYPIITTSSKAQTELSEYEQLADSIDKVSKNNKVFATTSEIAFSEANNQPIVQFISQPSISFLDKFVDKNPNTVIGIHILSKYYKSDPKNSYAIYRKLGKDAQNSTEGEKIGQELSHLINLLPGKMAPAFSGITPEGKSINIQSMRKKLILVEFWRSGSWLNRINHRNILGRLSYYFNSKDLGIISVSFDTDKNDWVSAIKEDKLTWPQISDLKGDNSPNATNWGVEQVPMYCILNGQGRFIAWNLPFHEVLTFLNNYVNVKD